MAQLNSPLFFNFKSPDGHSEKYGGMDKLNSSFVACEQLSQTHTCPHENNRSYYPLFLRPYASQGSNTE